MFEILETDNVLLISKLGNVSVKEVSLLTIDFYKRNKNKLAILIKKDLYFLGFNNSLNQSKILIKFLYPKLKLL